MSSRAVPLFLFSTALCVMAAVQPKPALAQTAIPDYFFKAWTINRDCTEQHAGLGSGHTIPQLQFRVSRNSVDGSTYALQPVQNTRIGRWTAGWSKVKLEYRAGARMTSVPADMECVPGQEASSSFLGQSGFSSSAEPYYGFEHWYGKVAIHGEEHHLLIFPRNTKGASSAVVVMIDAGNASSLQLDHNGTIIVED
jgi:hypothetical protein